MHGNKDGETGVDEDMAAEGMVGIGAWILGPALGYESVKHVAGVRATHVSLRRRA